MKMTELLHQIQSKAQRYTDRKYSSASTENIIRLYLTHLCSRYEQFETWGSTLTQMSP